MMQQFKNQGQDDEIQQKNQLNQQEFRQNIDKVDKEYWEMKLMTAKGEKKNIQIQQEEQKQSLSQISNNSSKLNNNSSIESSINQSIDVIQRRELKINEKVILNRIVNKNQFSQDQINQILCITCKELANEPLECSECEVLHCGFCRILNQKQGINACINEFQHQEVLSFRKPHKLLRQLFDSLQINCQYSEKGCEAIFSYQKLDQHQEQCQFYQKKCPNTKCLQIFQSEQFKEHLLNCQYNEIICNRCDPDQLIQKKIDIPQEIYNEILKKNHKCAENIQKNLSNCLLTFEGLANSQESQKIIQEKLQKKNLALYATQLQKKIDEMNRRMHQYIEQEVISQTESLIMKCKNGHLLEPVQKGFLNKFTVTCNLCNERGKGNIYFRCSICDFDRCQECFKNKRL